MKKYMLPKFKKKKNNKFRFKIWKGLKGQKGLSIKILKALLLFLYFEVLFSAALK